MGVLNVTPDSFSDGGRFGSIDDVLAAAAEMVTAGAAVIDVGAVSTRPGAAAVDASEEWRRLAGVLPALRAAVDVPLSLDTTRAAVLQRALDLPGGPAVDLVNDVSALEHDDQMGAVVASSRLPVVLMHRRGTPATMQDDPHYDDAPREVAAELSRSVERACAAGIARDDILLDPGIGFGKRTRDNLALLAALPELVALGFRTVLGCSRKSFLGGITGRDVGQREHATTATTVLGALAGVDLVRVHDVAAAVDALAVVHAVQGATRTAL